MAENLSNPRYQKAAYLITRLLDLDTETFKKIDICLQRRGLQRFFDNIDNAKLPSEAIEKLKALNMLLNSIDEKEAN